MSVAGPCELCDAGSAAEGCDRCGRVVCARHYDEPTGFCTVCLAELGGESGASEQEERSYPDAVDEYRF